eukprot:gb/GFBE01075594.1/.p1 GENE.gb/GFBE01075594.1/~~gb/GFBE01075594.1/.p1  ORF type:complete len:653 (+),score=71.44 gb/GFBE01075594.1/:1-1959(+)
MAGRPCASRAPSFDAHSLLPATEPLPEKLTTARRPPKLRPYLREVRTSPGENEGGSVYCLDTPLTEEALAARKGRFAAAASLLGFRRACTKDAAELPNNLQRRCHSRGRPSSSPCYRKPPVVKAWQPLQLGTKTRSSIRSASPAAQEVPTPFRLLSIMEPAPPNVAVEKSYLDLEDALRTWRAAAWARFGGDGVAEPDTVARQLAKWLALSCNTERGTFTVLANLEAACLDMGLADLASEVAASLWTGFARNGSVPLVSLLSGMDQPPQHLTSHSMQHAERQPYGALCSTPSSTLPTPEYGLAEDLPASSGESCLPPAQEAACHSAEPRSTPHGFERDDRQCAEDTASAAQHQSATSLFDEIRLHDLPGRLQYSKHDTLASISQVGVVVAQLGDALEHVGSTGVDEIAEDAPQDYARAMSSQEHFVETRQYVHSLLLKVLSTHAERQRHRVEQLTDCAIPPTAAHCEDAPVAAQLTAPAVIDQPPAGTVPATTLSQGPGSNCNEMAKASVVAAVSSDDGAEVTGRDVKTEESPTPSQIHCLPRPCTAACGSGSDARQEVAEFPAALPKHHAKVKPQLPSRRRRSREGEPCTQSAPASTCGGTDTEKADGDQTQRQSFHKFRAPSAVRDFGNRLSATVGSALSRLSSRRRTTS